MKILRIGLFCVFIILSFPLVSLGQVEIKGNGNTSATHTLITTNSTPDTTVFIRDDGNVGIGTTNPMTKLDVNGLINTGVGIQFPDGTILTTAGGTPYANVYTVAMSGGDFISLSAALIACAFPSPTNQYLIRVMPGVYNDPVVICKKYVDMRGSGKYSCTINGTVFGADSCVIENFFITQGIVCDTASPFIIHNIITNDDELNPDGIHIVDAQPWIKENEILDCTGYGINNIAPLESSSYGQGWFIANKILRNNAGGIRCQNTSPTISNNIIDSNHVYGIYLLGVLDKPSEPTIDDNVVGHTDYSSGGIGIFMEGYCEPRIIANDIYLNQCGITINLNTQPSILGNNINYNNEAGIRCFSVGSSKRVVIMANHIHSNTTGTGGTQSAGLWIQDCDPIVSQNNISQNRRGGVVNNDIDYSLSIVGIPSISLNVFDFIGTSGSVTANGLYNVTTAGAGIVP